MHVITDLRLHARFLLGSALDPGNPHTLDSDSEEESVTGSRRLPKRTGPRGYSILSRTVCPNVDPQRQRGAGFSGIGDSSHSVWTVGCHVIASRAFKQSPTIQSWSWRRAVGSGLTSSRRYWTSAGRILTDGQTKPLSPEPVWPTPTVPQACQMLLAAGAKVAQNLHTIGANTGAVPCLVALLPYRTMSGSAPVGHCSVLLCHCRQGLAGFTKLLA